MGSPLIHPTAIVGKKSKIGARVEIGPYAIVEDGATIGDGSRIMSHAFIAKGATLGKGNIVHMGAVIGHWPQHEFFDPATPSSVRIGDNNTFREYVTVHRAASQNSTTVIGSNNFFMAFAHIGHDCVVGDHVTVGNAVLLGGHAELHSRCVIAANSAVHQFTRIGSYAMVGGNATITKDMPPYMLVDDSEGKIGSINVVGLRRNGFSETAKRDIKNIYKIFFLSGLNTTHAVAKIRKTCHSKEAAFLLDFIAGSKRGILQHRRQKGI